MSTSRIQVSSTANSLFFSPGGVSSTYSGNGSSFADAALAFFSLVFEVGGSADPLTVLACFSANFLAFSAFLRSFSTEVGSQYGRSCEHRNSRRYQVEHARSFSLFTFFPLCLSPPSSPPSCWPMGSLFEAPSSAALVSSDVEGGSPVIGPVRWPTRLLNISKVLINKPK